MVPKRLTSPKDPANYSAGCLFCPRLGTFPPKVSQMVVERAKQGRHVRLLGVVPLLVGGKVIRSDVLRLATIRYGEKLNEVPRMEQGALQAGQAHHVVTLTIPFNFVLIPDGRPDHGLNLVDEMRQSLQQFGL